MILDDCLWIRGLRSKSSDPMFACAILGLLRKSSDPRFAQQNPRMVRIRTMRLTYILRSHCGTVLAFRFGPFQGTVLSHVHIASFCKK